LPEQLLSGDLKALESSLFLLGSDVGLRSELPPLIAGALRPWWLPGHAGRLITVLAVPSARTAMTL
jgi:hypothetical protein